MKKRLIELGLADRHKKIISQINLSGKGLEISPLFTPLILKESADVIYCDYMDFKALKDREKNNQPMIDAGLEVQEIDFVWTPGSSLKDHVNIKFDYIVSSHVLEHVPNIIGYIHEMRSVLKDDGVIAFVLPDARGTGEYYRNLSSVGQLLEAFLLNYTKPSPSMIYDGHRQVFEFKNLDYSKIDYHSSLIQWYHSKKNSKNTTIHSMNNYVDAHCWAFSEESIIDCFNELKEIGCFDFNIQKIESGATIISEIYISLTPTISRDSMLVYEESKNNNKKIPVSNHDILFMKDKITKLENQIRHGEKAFYEAVAAQNLLKREKENHIIESNKEINLLKNNPSNTSIKRLVKSGIINLFNLKCKVSEPVPEPVNQLEIVSKQILELEKKIHRLPFSLDYNQRVLTHTNTGLRVFVDTNDPHIAIHLIENGEWEPHVQKCMSRFLKTGGVFIDIGANIGLHSLFAKQLIGHEGRLYCFEASGKTFKILSENIEIGGLHKNNTWLYHKAVSSKNGTVKFHNFEHHAGMSSIQIDDIDKFNNDRSVAEIVDMITLDSIKELQTIKIDVVKIDVENFEYDVLLGMQKIIQLNSDLKIILEFVPIGIIEVHGNDKFIEMLDFIQKNFPYTYIIEKPNGELQRVYMDCNDIKAYDMLLSKTNIE